MEITNTTETNFVRFFGRNTRMKVLDFLIENDRTSWNTTEIMYNAKVGHTCLLDVLRDLLEQGIIKIDKKKYTMNKSNKFTKALYSIYNEINKSYINKILKEDKKNATTNK